MRIVIAGAGDVGKYLAKMFRSESHDIIIIDNNPQNLETLSSRFDIMTYEGNVTFMKDLMEVGVNKCDLFVAVTSHETVNMTACILASSLGAKKTLARVDNHEYIQPDNLRRFSKLGINQMIYPERLAAEEILMSLKTNWQRI
ncbi:MAG: NAD-binding protein, partial [Paludibacteraceae bacterium]|nr:NAD-binding protein [Paludibacteraceae bacterium]